MCESAIPGSCRDIQADCAAIHRRRADTSFPASLTAADGDARIVHRHPHDRLPDAELALAQRSGVARQLGSSRSPGQQRMGTPPSHLDPGLCDCLRDVLDPEIGLNIVDLGLVFEARRIGDTIAVKLTLTSRACPLGEMVIADVREKIAESYPLAARVDVQLVWDPIWSPDLITDRGYELLGRTRTRTLV